MKTWILIAMLALMSVGLTVAQEPTVAGWYACEGNDPDGSVYRGAVEVVADGSVYNLTWTMSNGAVFHGVGVLNGDAFAVIQQLEHSLALANYAIHGKVLDGKWTAPGYTTETFRETLTKTTEALAKAGSGIVA